MQIPDPGWNKIGSGMEKIRIRDKHPGSATLVKSVNRGEELNLIQEFFKAKKEFLTNGLTGGSVADL
jgi:hypothetical protein